MVLSGPSHRVLLGVCLRDVDGFGDVGLEEGEANV